MEPRECAFVLNLVHETRTALSLTTLDTPIAVAAHHMFATRHAGGGGVVVDVNASRHNRVVGAKRRRTAAPNPLQRWKVRALVAHYGATRTPLPWERTAREWAERATSARERELVEPLPDTHLAFIGCYLLASEAPGNAQRSYIGFTVDPARRLRQHNGELRGGARRTRLARPWRMLLHVSGFPSKARALAFEWAFQHPRRSRVARLCLAHPALRALSTTSHAYRARLVQLLIRCEPYASMPLRLTWLCERARYEHEMEFGDGDYEYYAHE